MHDARQAASPEQEQLVHGARQQVSPRAISKVEKVLLLLEVPDRHMAPRSARCQNVLNLAVPCNVGDLIPRTLAGSLTLHHARAVA